MAVHLMNTFYSIIGPIIGTCIVTALLLILATPLLIGLLMALKILRYREWLAILAVGMSLAILVESADFIYNLIYMTTSRFPPAMNIAVSVLTFANLDVSERLIACQTELFCACNCPNDKTIAKKSTSFFSCQFNK